MLIWKQVNLKPINRRKKNGFLCYDNILDHSLKNRIGILNRKEDILVESPVSENQYQHKYIYGILTLNTTEGKRK